MKKTIFLLMLLTASTFVVAQRKDKIKGSKIITIEKKQVESFESLDVSDNIEVVLNKGTECGLEIEADDNLHDVIGISVAGNTLHLVTLKTVFGFKKLSVKITYTDAFKQITTHDEATITAQSDLELETISINSFDKSVLNINAKVKNISIQLDDRTTANINSKATTTKISLSKNAEMKALLNSSDMIFDMYQKSSATIEGDVDNLKLRLDNNADFVGKNLATKTIDITTEATSNASVFVKDSAVISQTGKSEIQLFGDPKIDLKNFRDSASLLKKPLK